MKCNPDLRMGVTSAWRCLRHKARFAPEHLCFARLMEASTALEVAIDCCTEAKIRTEC